MGNDSIKCESNHSINGVKQRNTERTSKMKYKL